jgi:hypothetical protein
MTQELLAEYRAMVGLQLQFAERGDNDEVMEMQEVLERWIAERLRDAVVLAIQEMKAQPMVDIVCDMTVLEKRAYRKIQGDGLKFFCSDGFEGRRGSEEWKKYQIEMAELFVQGLLEQRLLHAVRPFMTMRVN